MGSLPSEGQEVMEWIKAEGHFDELRKKALDHLKNSEELGSELLKMLDNSKTLRPYQDGSLDRSNRKKVMEELRKELEKQLMDKAVDAVQPLIMRKEGEMFKLIQEKVHAALCAVYDKKLEQMSLVSAGGQPHIMAEGAGQAMPQSGGAAGGGGGAQGSGHAVWQQGSGAVQLGLTSAVACNAGPGHRNVGMPPGSGLAGQGYG
mmetsp:Transcript_18840/g.32177  ORF Transcript_18840/g.32177 Transcript_18840/m.32177 type:complete len:204 (-) Transcript_18840:550-1161(-)